MCSLIPYLRRAGCHVAPEIEYVQYPNQVLNNPAKAVRNVDSEEIRRFCLLMREIAGAQDGSGADQRKLFGLAAPQIGRPERIVLVDVNATSTAPSGDCEVYINPVVEILDAPHIYGWEGCFSVTGLWAQVPRRCRVGLTAVTPDGKQVEREFEGWPARILQHEIDHLDGYGFPYRLPLQQPVYRVPVGETKAFKEAKTDPELLGAWPQLDGMERAQLRFETTLWR
jgi:peptide deformylase